MSFFTSLLGNISHFENAAADIEKRLVSPGLSSEAHLTLLIEGAYCCAFVNLPRGVEMADEAISIAEKTGNRHMEAHALCAKAMNQNRIGYLDKAMYAATEALSIFEALNDEVGSCDAHFQLSTIIYLSVGPGNTPEHLQKAAEGYLSQSDSTGIYLTRIQGNMIRMLSGGMEDAVSDCTLLITELTEPHQQHLRCMAGLMKSNAMFLKQDLPMFRAMLGQWQEMAETTGNFHDQAMCRSLLTECCRIQQVSEGVMQMCIEASDYCERLGSLHGYSTSAIIMANICMEQGQYADALRYYKNANETAIEIKDLYKMHFLLIAMGATYLKLGDRAAAQGAFEDALQKSTVAGDRFNMASAQRHLAELAFESGLFDESVQRYKALFDTAQNEGLRAQDYGKYAVAIASASDDILSFVGIALTDRSSAHLQYLKKYLALALDQQINRDELHAYEALAEYYEAAGDLQDALDYRKRYIGLHEQIMHEQGNTAVTKLRLQYETQKKEQEIELLKKEKDESLLKERLRISRDLHDDIGATLSSISLYSAAVKQKLKDAQAGEADLLLDRISEEAREMVGNLSDTVWMLNLQDNSIHKLADRIRNYASYTFTAKNIQFRFTGDDDTTLSGFTIDQHKNIYLIIKEAINNAAKYSNAKEVKVDVSQKSNNIHICITDDGKGFEPGTATNGGGNGLRNMNERAHALGGMLTINSGEDSGTSIELQLPA